MPASKPADRATAWQDHGGTRPAARPGRRPYRLERRVWAQSVAQVAARARMQVRAQAEAPVRDGMQAQPRPPERRLRASSLAARTGVAGPTSDRAGLWRWREARSAAHASGRRSPPCSAAPSVHRAANRRAGHHRRPARDRTADPANSPPRPACLGRRPATRAPPLRRRAPAHRVGAAQCQAALVMLAARRRCPSLLECRLPAAPPSALQPACEARDRATGCRPGSHRPARTGPRTDRSAPRPP